MEFIQGGPVKFDLIYATIFSDPFHCLVKFATFEPWHSLYIYANYASLHSAHVKSCSVCRKRHQLCIISALVICKIGQKLCFTFYYCFTCPMLALYIVQFSTTQSIILGDKAGSLNTKHHLSMAHSIIILSK